MKQSLTIVLLLLGGACGLDCATAQQEWPRFRGPEGNGAVKGDLPTRWSELERLAWKSAVPGKGHSSPVIGNNKVWITTSVSEPLTPEAKAERLAKIKESNVLDIAGTLSLRALAFDLKTGQMIQNIEVFRPDSPEPIHITNTYASPTPVLHQGRLYVHFGTYGAACLDAETAEVLWRFNDLKVDHQNGPGSSPIVWDDLLITHYDGTNRQCIVALKLKDGSLAWQTDRSGEMHPTPELQKAYCTPTVVQTERGPELISPAANWVYAYNPRDGSELWKASYGKLGFSTVPCPITGHGMVYVCTSFMQSRLLAVRFGGRGDVTESHIAWTADSNISQKPSLAMLGDRIYVISDAGILTCLDAKAGNEIWRQRIGGKYAASPLVCQDRVYLFSTEGKTTVIQAGDQFMELAVNELESGIHSSPAAVDGSLIVRTESHLYRIE